MSENDESHKGSALRVSGKAAIILESIKKK